MQEPDKLSWPCRRSLLSTASCPRGLVSCAPRSTIVARRCFRCPCRHDCSGLQRWHVVSIFQVAAIHAALQSCRGSPANRRQDRLMDSVHERSKRCVRLHPLSSYSQALRTFTLLSAGEPLEGISNTVLVSVTYIVSRCRAEGSKARVPREACRCPLTPSALTSGPVLLYISDRLTP